MRFGACKFQDSVMWKFSKVNDRNNTELNFNNETIKTSCSVRTICWRVMLESLNQTACCSNWSSLNSLSSTKTNNNKMFNSTKLHKNWTWKCTNLTRIWSIKSRCAAYWSGYETMSSRHTNNRLDHRHDLHHGRKRKKALKTVLQLTHSHNWTRLHKITNKAYTKKIRHKSWLPSSGIIKQRYRNVEK